MNELAPAWRNKPCRNGDYDRDCEFGSKCAFMHAGEQPRLQGSHTFDDSDSDASDDTCDLSETPSAPHRLAEPWLHGPR